VSKALLVTAGGIVVAGVAFAAAYLSGIDQTYGFAVAGVAAILVWMLVPSKPGRTPKWLTLFFLALVFSTVLPSALSYGVQAMAVVGGLVAWLRTPPTERRGRVAVAWSMVILVAWVLLMVHPNVPDLYVGVLGARKTVLCLAGVVLGASIATHAIPAVERTVIKVLLLAAVVSIGLHQFAPSVEASIGRSAGEYTAVIAGQARMQGIFAGPFHVAILGLMLIGWGLCRWNVSRMLSLLSLVIGLATLYLSLVRTAYVVLALVILVVVILSPSVGKFIRRLSVAAIILVLGVAVISAVDPAALGIVESIADAANDDRFLGRFDSYGHALNLFNASPVFGWGSGSAGDTLGGYFINGQYVSPHNIVLKVMVEGGAIGLLLWVGLAVALLRGVGLRTSQGTLAVVMLTALAGMGASIASLEALPLSMLVFFFAGLALKTKAAGANQDIPDQLPRSLDQARSSTSR
jgi:O-antigen ligase